MKKLFTLIIVALLATTVGLANNVYVKVTSEDQLVAGKKYIFVHVYPSTTPRINMACGWGSPGLSCVYFTYNPQRPTQTVYNYTNDNQDAIDISAYTNVSQFTLGGETNAWTFQFPDNKYLAGNTPTEATSGNGSIVTSTTIRNNAKWIIEEAINEGFIVRNALYTTGVIQQAKQDGNFRLQVENNNFFSAYLYVQAGDDGQSILNVSETSLDISDHSGTFNVSGENLIKDVTLTIKDGSDEGFSLSQETINLINHGVEETEITVSYNGSTPIATATIIVKSGNISKEVTVIYESQGLNVSTNALELGASTSGSFTVSGQSLLTDISISLKEGSDEGFSVTPEIIEITDGAVGETVVTVSYTGTASRATAYVQVTSGDANKEVVVTVDIPRTLEVSTTNLEMGTNHISTFTVTGSNLAENISISFEDDSDEGFGISPRTIEAANNVNQDVTVTYYGNLPNAEATIIVKSSDLQKSIKVTSEVDPNAVLDEQTVIYVDKVSSGYFYAWNSDQADNGQRPGQAISSLTEIATIDGTECYVYRYTGEAAGLIFSDNNGHQTGEITPENGRIYKYIGGDVCYYIRQFGVIWNKNHANCYVYVWDVDNSTNDIHVSNLGTSPGTLINDLEWSAQGKHELIKVVRVELRVPAKRNGTLVEYTPYVKFSKGSVQTPEMELLLDRGYKYDDEKNECTLCEGLPVIPSIFPDVVFRTYLVNTYKIKSRDYRIDKSPYDGILTDEEIMAVKSLYISGKSTLQDSELTPVSTLKNLDGIEYFTNLDSVTISANNIVDLDFKHLDLSKAPNLKYVDISDAHKMVSFSLPESTLEEISLEDCESLPNDFETSSYANLKKLVLNHCPSIISVDVTQNPELTHLTLDNVSVPTLDLSQNSKLVYLHLASTAISEDNLNDNLAQHQGLKELFLTSNKNLNGTLFSLPNHTELNRLTIRSQNSYQTIDLTSNLKLDYLVVDGCQQLTQLTIPAELTTLQDLWIESNSSLKNQTFDLGNNKNLRQININLNGGPSLIKGVDNTMSSLRSIKTEGQLYEGNKLELDGCEQLHNLDVINCKLDKLSVTGCKLLGNIDNATASIPQDKNSQFIIYGNYLRSLDLEDVTLPYNFNLSTGTKAPFKDTDYVRHYSYNSQITPKLTPNVALVYHDRWAETPNYTYLVYIRLEQNDNDHYPADHPTMASEPVPTLNGLFNKEAASRGSDVDNVGFDYHRVKLWSRFAQTQEGPVLAVHGTNEIHALTGVDSPNWDENTTTDLSHVDPTHVLGKVLSLGMYSVPCGHDREYHLTTGQQGTTAYVEPAYISGTVSYLYSTLNWTKEAEVTPDGPSPMPQRDGGTGEDLDVYAPYNGAAITSENDYYTGITVENNAVVEKYDNAIPFKFDWKVELTNDPESIVTAIEGIHGDLPALIEEIQYYNVMGQMSHKPFSGVNIIVTRYSNGTTTTQKVIR